MAPVTDLAGTRLGPFELIRMLGKGAMGAVYLASDSILGRELALKLMLKGGELTDSERRDRMLREARAAASLVHPNVVQIFQVGEDETYRFIAMEYIEGMTLSRAAKRQGGRLTENFVIARMWEAADALKLAASLGICHRDIKPSNLLLTAAGTIKIADFGLAAQVDGGKRSTGTLEGTPQYMSPEQWSGGPTVPASDVYSLGCTMYHMLTGVTPYPTRDFVSSFRAHCTSPVPDPKVAVPGMTPVLADLLKRCMAKEPADRPTAAEVAEVLDDLLALQGSPVSTRSVLEPMPASTRSDEPPPSSRMSSVSIIPPGEVGLRSYHDWFGLRGHPFNDARDPSSFWDAGSFGLALYGLGTQILAGEQPAMLLGPPGSGRTFVCEMLQRRFPRIHLAAAEPQRSRGARLLFAACEQLGIKGASPTASSRLLVRALIEHALPEDDPEAIAVVIVDGMDPSHRDLLRELDEILASAVSGRFGLILVGAEDLPARLVESGAPERLCGGPQPMLLRGMTLPEMVEYVDFRMKAIGGSSKGLELDAASRQFLHARSGGIPRLVNIYCHNALTIAALKQETSLRFSSVRAGVKSNEYLTPETALALFQV